MELLERARELHKRGFFGDLPEKELARIAAAAERGPIPVAEAPATALLLAAGRLLEIPAEAAPLPGDYESVLRSIERHCGGAFKLGAVHPRIVGEQEEEEGHPLRVLLRFELDGRACEAELSHDEEMIDLSFVFDIDAHLERKGDARRLCPLVELMDDTARYVFVDPEIVEQAELDEVIAAPDFGG